MAVSTTVNKISYTAAAAQTVFAYTFKIFTNADLKVYVNDVLKTLTTDYTISGAGVTSGGNITFGSGLTLADIVVIERVLILTQGTDYIENDPFPAASHEDALDRLTFITQQHQDALDRSVKFATTVTDVGDVEVLGTATARANKLFAFDSAGDLYITQEIGVYKGTDATTTTAAYIIRDIVKSTTAAQLDNVYICTATSAIGIALTNTSYWSLIIDAVTASTSSAAAAASAAAALASENVVTPVLGITSEIQLLADLEDGTVATSALKTLAELEDGTVGTNVLTDLAAIRLKISAVGGIDDKIEGLYDNLYTHIYNLGSGTVPNDIIAVSSRLADITQLAHIEDGTVATNAIQDVATIKTDVTTVAGVSADVTTVATSVAPSITTLLGDIDDFLDRYIGALGSPPTVMHTAGTMYFDTTASEMRVGDGSGTGASQWHTMNPSAANQTNIDTVATNILDVQQVAADTTHINDLAVISGYLNTIGINLQAVIQTGNLSNMADINLLADIEDGTVVTKGMSTLAATTTDIDRIFLYAIKDEMGRILSGLPPTDSYLSAWLQANHTDGYARVDFNADGTIDVLNDLQLHIKYTADIATAAEIATWTARIGTPALSDSTLYSKYLDPNTVIPPFWAVRLNKDAINTVAASINAYGLPVSLFSINGNGIVPAPTASDIANNYVLRADGTWVAP